MINSFVKLSITAILMLISSGFYKPAETVYPSVEIGTQTWMSENLNVTHFRNGDSIPEAKTDEEWKTASDNKQPAWCYYNNDTANGKKYGKLYNWYAVNDSRRLAPAGWHIPSDSEWTVLKSFLGKDAGTKMRSVKGWDNTDINVICSKCNGWSEKYRSVYVCSLCNNLLTVKSKSGNGNGTDSSGFKGLPGGYHTSGRGYYDFGQYGYWWSSTRNSSYDAYGCYLYNYSGYVFSVRKEMGCGLSVRCLKD